MRQLKIRIAAILCVALGGCHLGFAKHPKPPTGQVVATVDGEEITQRQLLAELGDVRGLSPQAQKDAVTDRLHLIIQRKGLAHEFHSEGGDETPDFVMLKERVLEELSAQALEDKIASQVPAVTRDEAERYVADNPAMFANRKIFVVDQIRVSKAANPHLDQKLIPINTMPEVVGMLNNEHIPFTHTTTSLDSLSMNPSATDGISKLPAQAVFFFPSGGDDLINQITETRDAPVTGEDAVAAATRLLTRQHRQRAVEASVQQIMAKASPTISYSAAFAPRAKSGDLAKQPAHN